MKKLLVVFVVIAIAVGGYFLFVSRPIASTPLPTVKATIGNATFTLYAPRNERELEIGLAAYKSIEPDQGMIFRGMPVGVQSIWMKDMKFDIDVLWVSKDNQVVYVVQSMSRSSYPKKFHNPVNVPSAYVIELAAEATITHGITVGQTVTIEN
ncbi:MAG: DUF192 domain-containing protein [Candidatus Saccharimonadales bacterium]